MIYNKTLDLRNFSKVIHADSKETFLRELRDNLRSSFLILGSNEEGVNWYIKLALEMIEWSTNLPLLRDFRTAIEAKERIDQVMKEHKNHFIRTLFVVGELAKLHPDYWQLPSEVSISDELIVAATIYNQNGWGNPGDLKMDLQLAG